FGPLPVGCQGGLPDIVATLTATAVTDKVERTAVGGQCRLGLPTAGIHRCPQVIGTPPMVALAPRHIDVATAHPVGAIATGEEQVFAVRRYAMRSFIVEVRIDLPFQKRGFLPYIGAILA